MAIRLLFRLFLFTFLFATFFFFPQKTFASQPAVNSSSGPTNVLPGQNVQYTFNAYDGDSNITAGIVYVSPNAAPGSWTPILNQPGNGTQSLSFTATWVVPNNPGEQWIVVAQVNSTKDPGGNENCSSNPFVSYPYCPTGNCTTGPRYDNCGPSGIFYVNINTPPPASTILITAISAQHNIYDLCINPNPNPDTMLLEYLIIPNSYQNNGGEGFDSFFTDVSYQSGDGRPTGAGGPISYNGMQWWRYGPQYLAPGSPFLDYRLFGASNTNGFTGLLSGTRTVRLVMYNSAQDCTVCNGYGEATAQSSIYLDRDAPNYTGDWPSPNSGSPKLRTTTPSSTSPYDPAGIIGMTVELESRSLEDVGGFGVDRVDYWIGYLGGDSAAGIKAGNPSCAPSPPYYGDWFGDICKNSGPFSCPSFTIGGGQAWFINSGVSSSWNTNGFTPGTRVIAVNGFDNMADHRTQNVRTYTGNTGNPGSTFGRVNYNLMPPHAPTAYFSPYPPAGLINASPGQVVTLPTAYATDDYGYLVNEELWIANQSRTQTADIPCNAPNSWVNGWCSVQLHNFTKRANYNIASPTVTAPSAPGLYDVVINAKDQFGEKCTGDPTATTYLPQWPPLWTNCGANDFVQINVQPPNTITGTVFIDSNANGIKDGAEVGYNSGATNIVSLSGDGSKSTPASGVYTFNNLADGTYSVTLSGIAGYKVTTPSNCTANNPGTPCTAPAVSASGGNTYTVDFGITLVYTISGNVFVDTNANGTKDAGEGGYNSNGINIISISGVGSTPTNVNGDYSFTNVPAGTYAVTLTVPLNYYATTANPINNVVVPPNKTGQNFGIAPPRTISGNVFNDVDKDGILDAGESNYTGGITITSSGGTVAYPAPQGSYTISNLVEGTYTVSYTSLPADFQMTYPTNGPPPSYNVTVGPSCVSTPPYWSCSGGNVINLNFGISNSIPWFQCIGADCRKDDGFIDYVPTVGTKCGPNDSYASIDNKAGQSWSPGVIFSGDSSYSFCSGGTCPERSSTTQWIAGGTAFPEVFQPVRQGITRTSFKYYSTVAAQSGVTIGNIASSCGGGGIGNCNLDSSLPNGVYQAYGNLTLTNSSPYNFPSSNDYVILVDGDLTIKGEIHVPIGSTVTFSVSGDIIVDKDLGQSQASSINTTIEGFFSADGNFIVQGYGASGCAGPTSDKRLNIGGSVVTKAGGAAGSLDSQRDLCGDNLNCPAYAIIERPDFYLNAPDFIKYPNFVWQEVAP